MADAAYNSAIVDPRGRLLALASTPEGSKTLLIADVPLGGGDTLCARLGDWLGWLSLAGMAVFAVAMPLALRRTPAGPKPNEGTPQ